MKRLLKLVLSLAIVCSFTSCEEEEKDTTNGLLVEAPYVRIIIDTPTVDSSALDTAEITATVSAPANNVASWSAQVRLADSDGNILADYVDAITVTEFPSEISLSTSALASALGLDISEIDPADIFEFAGSSTGTDGVTITEFELGSDLIGQPEQRNAYDFDVVVFCAPVEGSVGGDWIIDMIDTYGDGWDGAFVTVTIDGEGTDYTIGGGDAAVHVVTVPEGASLVFSYTSGSWEEEHIFTIEAPDGTIFGPYQGDDGISQLPFCFF